MVASGETKPAGKDAASGDDVQIADFSAVKTPGKDYTLKVGADTSHPFDIGADVLRKLKYDALAYFYQTRSGIAIAMPYAGGKQWTHAAGHVQDREDGAVLGGDPLRRVAAVAAVLSVDDGTEHDDAQALLRSRYPQYRGMALADLPVIAMRIERVTSWGNLAPVAPLRPGEGVPPSC